MSKYRVEVCLNVSYETEADSEEEAIETAFDYAENSGGWDYTVEEIDDDEEEE